MDDKIYLITYYVKNTNIRTMAVYDTLPYKSEEHTLSENQVLPLIEVTFRKYPFLRFCSVMTKRWSGDKEYQMGYTVINPYFSEEPDLQDNIPLAAENRVIDDSLNKIYMSKCEHSHKGFEVNLESEQKVIRIGSYFYDLKGVLICEANEEERKKFYCNRFMTYPIVDDDWHIYEGDEIIDGLYHLIVGKKGDTVTIWDMYSAAQHNVISHDCAYDDILCGLERHGITISNRKSLDSTEELSDIIVIIIDKEGDRHFRMSSHPDSYYIPSRYFRVGDDSDELYEYNQHDRSEKTWRKISTCIIEDVEGLAWFFNKPKLRVFLTAHIKNKETKEYEYCQIPEDWFYSVHTLEDEINNALAAKEKKYKDYHNTMKRPDIPKEK